jgi:hypothetical protein
VEPKMLAGYIGKALKPSKLRRRRENTSDEGL